MVPRLVAVYDVCRATPSPREFVVGVTSLSLFSGQCGNRQKAGFVGEDCPSSVRGDGASSQPVENLGFLRFAFVKIQ